MKIRFILLSLSLSLFFFDCKKEDIIDRNNPTTAIQNSGSLIFNVTDKVNGLELRSGNSKTVLGALRQNPFTVQNLAAAHRFLYNSSITTVPTTDLYVKFLPTTLDQINLLEKTDENFYDYPLEYAVDTMGDYYQDMQSLLSFPTLYAVVKSDFNFPQVPYQIIANLNLSKNDPLLLAESFRLTGNQSDIQSYIVGANGINIEDLDDDVQARIPPEPECPPGFHAVLYIDETTRPFTYTWECEPIPPSDPILNGCGCAVTQNRRHPGGCIRLDDTELSMPGFPNTFVPVRRVKIIIKDTWFTEDETMTNDNGCWQITKEYKGNAWMWIKFKSDRCKIRGAGEGVRAVWDWISAVKDYIGKLEGPAFNSIRVDYNRRTNQGSREHIYWGAATVNNAVHEFYEYAAQDGINAPKSGLDIYVDRNHANGAAYMSSQIWIADHLAAVLASQLTWIISVAFLPEVYIGIDFQNSDRQKRLAYHEIAHSSHYTQVGTLYWNELVEAEALALQLNINESHGNSNSHDAGRIALCESWADHIGNTYAHRSYPTTSFGGTFQALLESSWNESQDHIPIRLYNDLSDIGETLIGIGTISACNEDGSGCTLIDDQVSGFTIRQMYTCLTLDITNPEQFRQRLILNHLASTSNTEAQVNTLFNEY